MKRIYLFVGLLATIFAEEGMWPFDALPVHKIQEECGITLDQEWIEHVQKSCLRISLGGSGSFVSKEGLLLTNHHVGVKAIYNLSSEERDLIKNGFLAKTSAEELKCTNMYVDQLVSIRDITEEVERSLQFGASLAEKEKKRKAVLAKIQEEASNDKKFYPEIVTLYQGARYQLYLYRRYTDVRLVMAPEKAIAFFGGDVENFEYPRYDLDCCFFRVYEDDEPLPTEHYLAWQGQGAVEGEPIFVVGNPGRTERMLTAAHIAFFRDMDISFLVRSLEQSQKDLHAFSLESAENERIATGDLFSCENSLKVLHSYQQGLREGCIIENKRAWEKNRQEEYWARLAQALEEARSYYPAYMVLEGRGSIYSKLYAVAKTLVRLATERSKPNEERLEEYRNIELPVLESSLFSAEPLYKSLEKVRLVAAFQRTIALLGEEHPLSLYLKKSDIDLLLQDTKLDDLTYRKYLYDHPEEVQKSLDPFILLAREVDPFAREIRATKEAKLDAVRIDCYTEITKVLLAERGEDLYPDATFSLRLSMGSIQGYEEEGCYLEPMTTLGGVFSYAEEKEFKEPYTIPEQWLSKQSLLESSTPFNFVSTHDITGGNSGSPVINAKGELVGLIFDGNRYATIDSFGFTGGKGRAISVHTAAIQEVLEKIYHAEALLQELSITSVLGGSPLIF